MGIARTVGFSFIHCAAASLLGLLGVACGGAPDAADDSAARVGVGSGGREEVPGPDFLPPAAYADLVQLAASFPFGVTRKVAAPGAVLGARWGRHGGPVVTTQSFDRPDALGVVRWALGNTAAAKQELAPVAATDLPEPHFYGADGFVDLPFGGLSMQTYTSPGDGFPGEVLFYTRDYDRLVGRARVNGFYSGVGISRGSSQRLLYSGLSALTEKGSTANDSGLYAADVCSSSPVPSGACAGSGKLFGWSGFSGPVVTDANGNVFVAASIVDPAGSRDVVFGLSKTQALATGPVQQGTLSAVISGGTASLAAISQHGASSGWIVAKGYDGEQPSPAYARSYHVADGAMVADGELIERAIVAARPTVSVSLFADPLGNLWLAVDAAPGTYFLALAPRT